MIAVIQSEYLKYKRTFTRKLILCAPLFILILALLVKIVAPDQNGDWSFLLTVIYNWWPVIFIPIGMALFAALIHIQEKKAGNLVNLRIHNVSPCRVWFANRRHGHPFLLGNACLDSLHACFGAAHSSRQQRSVEPTHYRGTADLAGFASAYSFAANGCVLEGLIFQHGLGHYRIFLGRIRCSRRKLDVCSMELAIPPDGANRWRTSQRRIPSTRRPFAP